MDYFEHIIIILSVKLIAKKRIKNFNFQVAFASSSRNCLPCYQNPYINPFDSSQANGEEHRLPGHLHGRLRAHPDDFLKEKLCYLRKIIIQISISKRLKGFECPFVHQCKEIRQNVSINISKNPNNRNVLLPLPLRLQGARHQLQQRKGRQQDDWSHHLGRSLLHPHWRTHEIGCEYVLLLALRVQHHFLGRFGRDLENLQGRGLQDRRGQEYTTAVSGGNDSFIIFIHLASFTLATLRLSGDVRWEGYNMGSKQSTALALPTISKAQWQQMPLPAEAEWRVCHGHYRLLVNPLTGERMEQYALAFEGQQEFQQYVRCFAWRQREEHLVGGKYLEHLRAGGLCGGRERATVYLPHTPHRLSGLQQIALPEALYLLSAALAGFQKLYAAIGYFRPSAEMVGVDADGRARVWLNSNFSSNYLYGPHYVEATLEERQGQDEEAMVREVVVLVERRASYEHYEEIPRFDEILQGERVGFSSARRAISAYSQRYGVSVLKHFLSLLKLNGFSEESQELEPTSSPPSRRLMLSAHETQLVHSACPALESSQHGRSEQHRAASNVLPEKEGPGDTTGETVPARSVLPSTPAPLGGLPKISFNYGLAQQQCFLTPSPSHSSTLRNSLATPHFSLSLPLSLRPEQRAPTKRLTFSDKHREHFLDEELVEDMARLLQ